MDVMNRALLSSLLAAACLALPPNAAAADTLVAPDTAARQVAALDGTLVWVTGAFGHQRLMQRTPDGTISPVKGAPEARSYAIDLGHDSDGRLLLTYERCDTARSCKVLWNDLDGRRATYRNLTLPRCTLSTAPSQWRTNIAYGLFCTRNGRADDARSGLYVKPKGRAPRRLPRPRDAVRFGARGIDAVDLRATRVAAIAADIYEYAFSQSLTGRDMWTIFAAASEGDSSADARGVALGTAGTLWTLTDAEHLDDPKETIIFRRERRCLRTEVIRTPPTGDYAATGLAVDGARLYLVVPGAGIVMHDFTPGPMPSC
jgi:hypothetical protein